MSDTPKEIWLQIMSDGAIICFDTEECRPEDVHYIREDVAEEQRNRSREVGWENGFAEALSDNTIKELVGALEKARSRLVEHEKYLDSKLAYDGVYKPSKTVCEIDAALAKQHVRAALAKHGGKSV